MTDIAPAAANYDASHGDIVALLEDAQRIVEFEQGGE
jgi:hypothetical protein